MVASRVFVISQFQNLIIKKSQFPYTIDTNQDLVHAVHTTPNQMSLELKHLNLKPLCYVQ